MSTGSPPTLSLFPVKGFNPATGKFGFHQRGEGRKQKQAHSKTERKMSLRDLLLSAFPVAASQGWLSKVKLGPRRITPTAGQPSLRQLCLSFCISFFFFYILEPKQAPGVLCVLCEHVAFSCLCLYKTLEKRKAKVAKVPEIRKGNPEALPGGRERHMIFPAQTEVMTN